MTIILALLSGLLLAFSFPPFNCWYLAWVALVPAFLGMSERGPVNFLAGWAAGFVFHTILLFWLTKVAGPVYLLLPVYLGLYWGLFFFLLSSLPEKGRVFMAPAIWFFLELLSAHALTGFPWLPLGLSQHCNRLVLPAARLAGVHGLSVLLLLANATLAFGFRRKHLASLVLSAVALAALGLVLRYAPARIVPSASLKILAVQSNVLSRRDASPEDTFRRYYRDTVALLSKIKPDLVIWPESSYPNVLAGNRSLTESLKRLTAENRCALMLGTMTYDAERDAYYNSAVLVRGDRVDVYRKTHLVPYGEFILGGRCPWVKRTYERIAGYTPCLSPGVSLQPFDLDGRLIGPLVCFENIFPELARTSVNHGSQVLFVITNDSWFQRSFGPYQHFAHNVIRAAETGRYFVQTASTGITGIAAPDGTVTTVTGRDGGRQSEIFVKGCLARSIPLTTGETPYTRHGDLPLTLILLTLTGAFLCRK